MNKLQKNEELTFFLDQIEESTKQFKKQFFTFLNNKEYDEKENESFHKFLQWAGKDVQEIYDNFLYANRDDEDPEDSFEKMYLKYVGLERSNEIDLYHSFVKWADLEWALKGFQISKNLNHEIKEFKGLYLKYIDTLKITPEEALIKSNRQIQFEKSGQYSLKELVEIIEDFGVIGENGKPKSIYFDFGMAVPKGVHTFEGYKDEIAIGYTMREGYPLYVSAQEFLEELKICVQYESDLSIGDIYGPLWVANKGVVTKTGVFGISNKENCLIILTEHTGL